MSRHSYILYLYLLNGSQRYVPSTGARSKKSVLNQQSAIAPQIADGANAQSSRLTLVKKIGRSLSHWLWEGREPKVWQVRDRLGNVTWRIYDPVSGRSATCANETEARIWLEQLHFY